MARKERSDSPTVAVAAAQAASLGPIKPPAHLLLREGDWPFWNAVVTARAAADWTDADLAFAVNLARCQADIMRTQVELETEGDILVNARGTPVMNPKHTLIEMLTRRAAALSAKIHVHALATTGRSEDSGKRAGVAAAARENAGEDDGLMFRLHAV